MIKAKSPKTKSEFEKMYDLRWRVLRKPWKQPKGSEKDELENRSFNIIILSGKKVVGTGRLHRISKTTGQIRFMVVDPKYRGKGIGNLILQELEKKARKLRMKKLVANVRKDVKNFYKKNGWKIIGKSHTLFGEIPHCKMEKKL